MLGGIRCIYANPAVNDRLPPFEEVFPVDIRDEHAIRVHESNKFGIREVIRPKHEKLLPIMATEMNRIGLIEVDIQSAVNFWTNRFIQVLV